MRDICSNDRLNEEFINLLDAVDERIRMYVYEMPAILKGRPFPDLCQYLRDHCGGGTFYVMFRRGETMLLAGLIGIAVPPRRNTPLL